MIVDNANNIVNNATVAYGLANIIIEKITNIIPNPLTIHPPYKSFLRDIPKKMVKIPVTKSQDTITKNSNLIDNSG